MYVDKWERGNFIGLIYRFDPDAGVKNYYITPHKEGWFHFSDPK